MAPGRLALFGADRLGHAPVGPPGRRPVEAHSLEGSRTGLVEIPGRVPVPRSSEQAAADRPACRGAQDRGTSSKAVNRGASRSRAWLRAPCCCVWPLRRVCAWGPGVRRTWSRRISECGVMTEPLLPHDVRAVTRAHLDALDAAAP